MRIAAYPNEPKIPEGRHTQVLKGEEYRVLNHGTGIIYNEIYIPIHKQSLSQSNIPIYVHE